MRMIVVELTATSLINLGLEYQTYTKLKEEKMENPTGISWEQLRIEWMEIQVTHLQPLLVDYFPDRIGVHHFTEIMGKRLPFLDNNGRLFDMNKV